MILSARIFVPLIFILQFLTTNTLIAYHYEYGDENYIKTIDEQVHITKLVASHFSPMMVGVEGYRIEKRNKFFRSQFGGINVIYSGNYNMNKYHLLLQRDNKVFVKLDSGDLELGEVDVNGYLIWNKDLNISFKYKVYQFNFISWILMRATFPQTMGYIACYLELESIKN